MKIRDILENLILVAIVLVIIQTFLFELSTYMHWSISARNALIFCGLFFDFLFTVEFTTRTTAAGIRGGRKDIFAYWFYERGWIDFLSSVPLLLVDSGPTVYNLIFPSVTDATTAAGAVAGTAGALKIVKAVRVTRILRLVRIIKIFGKIHNAESKMAQHHTTTIATIAVFTIVCSLMGFGFFTDSAGTNKRTERREYYQSLLGIEKEESAVKEPKKAVASPEAIRDFLSLDKHVLRLYHNNTGLIDRKDKENIKDDETFKKYYSKGGDKEDYDTIEGNNYMLYFSYMDINKQVAESHIGSFIIIVLTVLAFMFIYTRIFVQSISDVLHILNKGFRKKDYNLQIKIRKEFSEQEIFRLAKFYNDSYLPAKLRRLHAEKEKKSSGLSMNDLTNFNK
ncbi:MAG: hypothetical protein GY754_15065 [bacterium]|nr:hypothetical protein [bacterium]